MAKPSFEISPDTRKLAEFLQPREQATYSEMNRRIGRQIDGTDRHVLYGALRVLQREYGVVFVAERGVGIKRATNGQIASLSTDHAHRKIKRTVRRAKKIEPLVNSQTLSPDERDAFWIGRVVTQVLDVTVGKRMRSKIADEIKDRGEAVDIRDVIALFQKRAH